MKVAIAGDHAGFELKNAKFTNEERHVRRDGKLKEIESKSRGYL